MVTLSTSSFTDGTDRLQPAAATAAIASSQPVPQTYTVIDGWLAHAELIASSIDSLHMAPAPSPARPARVNSRVSMSPSGVDWLVVPAATVKPCSSQEPCCRPGLAAIANRTKACATSLSPHCSPSIWYSVSPPTTAGREREHIAGRGLGGRRARLRVAPRGWAHHAPLSLRLPGMFVFF